MIRLTTGNQTLLDIWRGRRDRHAVPRIGATTFIRDPNIGKSICIQFKSPDGSVRVAHAGGNIERLIGIDLTGMVVSKVFNGSEQDELADMQRAKFLHPMVIHSHSNTNTLAGEMIQLEMLQLPFINQATEDVIYVIGAFEWTHANSRSNLGGAMKDRSLLSRTILDIKTLKPVENEFTFPPVKGAQKLKAVSAQEVNRAGNHEDAERVEL
ncbi:hypothetical protein BN1012_Phect932 [Candidatus Phaeomarinobacter ectocarpi]|uniref:Uncharacterized protein n=1 Tax=Candidatus Phaeomarinibacter ectocarpi TaxID=1458461 RepID=X5MMD3_9HYPH|nr:PAS domain-containing protein [Candidatus Phaeomarinobacter ectocarpi]CDO59146.1 hypothetical protein BN1012_Phect932 [Candidatus Phaeomarinobacter ectocarpi]